MGKLTSLRLTGTQVNLLRDLIALQDAGYISPGGIAYVGTGYYDDGQVDVPPVVTEAGRAALQEQTQSKERDG